MYEHRMRKAQYLVDAYRMAIVTNILFMRLSKVIDQDHMRASRRMLNCYYHVSYSNFKQRNLWHCISQTMTSVNLIIA